MNVQRHDSPVIDGDTATFIWHGEQAPQLIGDFSGWEGGKPLDLTQTAPGVWTHTLTLPADAYIEYVFWRDGQRLADPLNPDTTPDGLGHHNSYFYMPAAAPTPLPQRRWDIAHGTVTRHGLEGDSFLAGRKRPVVLYQPPTAEPCPLLVVLDGQDYRPRGRLLNIVDALIAERRIRPVALALIHHGGRARAVEYACNDAHLSVLLERLVPLARAALNLLDLQAHRGAFGILGASMGGLMALYAGLRAPHVFGHVLSQSGAFTLDALDTVVWDLVRHGPLPPLRIWMDVGRYERLLDCNRRLHHLLVERGYDVTYREYNAGHNYPAWRNDVGRGLELLFGR
jgi:enterochelin esterase family protein